MRDPPSENRRLWNEWSDDFQALWNADTDEELPPAPCPFTDDPPGGEQPELLPTVEGIDFVELGCGGGQATVGTAAAGADRAVGVDFSGGQLRHARPLRDHYGVDAEFVQGDVTDVPLADDAFDAAYSGWVLQMVEDLDAYFAEARRILRDDGVLVFGVPHPFYELFDPETGEVERSYHADPRRTITIDEGYESELVVFDRTVGDLHAAAVRGGFEVRRVLEPGSDDPEDYDGDSLSSTQRELLATVPRRLRFWAVPR
ncbi:class I SAM-dependent methyltransferase [Haloglomus litoreum]|uniref:class I SAM-dependent methyltransferase n=1 Tax=Haloglomus litoreum TaxID=3034026 RepID=UPI0023E760CD|nr:class I SAM-dependent methyltransferase [Haloglomus sp. DT116]